MMRMGMPLCVLLLSATAALAEVKVERLRCEYLANPQGIDCVEPRLSWIIASEARGEKQTAYRILVASSAGLLSQDQGDLWDSGKVASDASCHVPYAGKPLTSFTRCFWKVRVWDKDGKESAFSDAASWTMGILDEAQWGGKWLGYSKPFDHNTGWSQKAPSPVFRKGFALKGPVKSAVVTIAGLGYHELHLNGRKVGDHVLDPGFTRYDRRVLYVTHDVTEMLREGKNALGVMLGNGWYNSHTRCVWDFDKAPWRGEPRLLLNLRVEYADGTVETIVTDESWKASTGPMVLDGIRNGHVYDARLEQPGWDTADFDDAAWVEPHIMPPPKGALRAQMIPPMRVTETIAPVNISEVRPGVWLFDMGQNMAGWAQLKVKGPAGTEVKMVFSERVNPNGKLDRKEIAQHVKSGPFQTDVYILSGKGDEIWEPKFAYHGFRWVEVSGLTDTPTAETLCGRVIHTDFEKAGVFECSNDLLNTIQKHTLWSYRGNFHSIPTDCPHREKNGWTGDAHLATEQAMFNWENSAGYSKWLNDLYDEQQPNGNLPGIVPSSGWGYAWGNGPAWDSAYVLVPWYLYEYRGDTRVLAQHYERMKRYVDYMTSRSKDNLVSHGLGDWVPAKTVTPEIVTSSGYYYADALIVARTAALLGKADDAQKYNELAEKIRNTFNRKLYKGNGVYANGSQTALSCALYQGLVPAEEKAKVVEQLARAVEAKDWHLDTGILGAKYLFRTLSQNGSHYYAWKIATQKTAPGYGDWIRRDATTLWEDWGDGASRNHIMFGDISAWFYQYLAGINADIDQPGFKHIILRPRMGGDLTFARGETESMYGKIASRWQDDKRALTLTATVPANTTATVYLPIFGAIEKVQEGGRPLADAPGVKLLRNEDGCAVIEVGSGQYTFVSPK